MRECGECSLCCKVLSIAELSKPAGKWCEHCSPGKGCQIYERRPQECREFACEWLTDLQFGDEWKPSRSKLVLRMIRVRATGRLLLLVNVDPGFPGAWLKSPYYAQLKNYSRHFAVQVIIGNREIMISPK
jgi:hypothetical protein